MENLYQGQLRPFTRRYDSKPPDELEQFQFETHSPDMMKDYQATVKIYLRKPSISFPNTGVFFQFKNGQSSVFQRIDPSQLTACGAWLIETGKKMEKVYTECKGLEVMVNQQIDALEQNIQRGQQANPYESPYNGQGGVISTEPDELATFVELARKFLPSFNSAGQIPPKE